MRDEISVNPSHLEGLLCIIDVLSRLHLSNSISGVQSVEERTVGTADSLGHHRLPGDRGERARSDDHRKFRENPCVWRYAGVDPGTDHLRCSDRIHHRADL